MKKIKYMMVALVTACGLSSCTDWLDLKPEDTLSAATYFTNAEEIHTGVMSAYNRLQMIYDYDQLPLMIEDISDDGNNFYFSNSAVNLFSKTLNNSFSNYWQYSYEMIIRSCDMISVIDQKKYSVANAAEEREIQALYGEVHFLRALAYFNLVRTYGDVPKVTEPFKDPMKAFGVGRSPIATIYNDVIIPDLNIAVANCYPKNELPSSEIGRVTLGAAQTLLAKVYLTPPVLDYNKAKTLLESVINSKSYSLMSNYIDIFDLTKKNHQESIFEIQYNSSLGYGSFYNRWMTNEAGLSYGMNNGTSNLVPSDKDLVNLMLKVEKDEVRYHASLDSGGLRSNVWYYTPMVVKQVSFYTAANRQNHNYMLLRYADVMLMYAEVLLQTGGSKTEILKYINPIRHDRAKLNALTEAQATLDAILHERRLELNFEGHRWFDLVRTGKAMDVMKNHFIIMEGKTRDIPEYQFWFPIPLGEIQKDPTLMQNYGY